MLDMPPYLEALVALLHKPKASVHRSLGVEASIPLPPKPGASIHQSLEKCVVGWDGA